MLLAVALSLAAAGCGGDEEGKPIPAATATALNTELDGVQARLDQGSAGACRDILEGPREPEHGARAGADRRDAGRRGLRRALGARGQLRQPLGPRAGGLRRQGAGGEVAAGARADRRPTETTPTETTPTETTPTGDHADRRRRRPDEEPLPHDGDGDNGGGVPGNGNGNGNGGGGVGTGSGRMSTPTEVAGRYVIERRLGAGGMSTVFMANDTVLERPVAVKLLAEHLADDEAFVYRFRREALSAARLQHPNIVQVFDSGQDPSIASATTSSWSTWTGPSAADMLRERKQLEVDETVAARARRLPRARLRAPRRRGPPRREAREPPVRRGDGAHEARGLRDRQGGGADADHAGRLRARHRRLPVARAGPRRGGGAGLGHLLAGRVRLPVPHRAGSRTSTRRSRSWR